MNPDHPPGDPPPATVNLSACPVCGANGLLPGAEKSGYRFNRCRRCGYLFVNPRPAQKHLDSLYTATGMAGEPVCDKAGSRLRRAFLKLPRFLPYAWREDVLDLGCGGGFVAQALSLVARSSTGIDISENAIAYARKRFRRPRFFCMNFSDLLATGNQYGFIHSSEVIEHVSDVNLYMQVLQKLARKGGHVYLTTPDAGHPRVPMNINDWDVFQPPAHVQFFSRTSMSILFARYGFDTLKFYKNRKPGLHVLARKS